MSMCVHVCPQFLCTVIAILLHFVYMSAFAWTLVESLHVYRMLTEPRNIDAGPMRFYYVVGWGLPAVITGEIPPHARSALSPGVLPGCSLGVFPECSPSALLMCSLGMLHECSPSALDRAPQACFQGLPSPHSCGWTFPFRLSWSPQRILSGAAECGGRHSERWQLGGRRD